MDILSYIGGFVHHTQHLQVKTEFVGEDSGEKRQFSVSPDCQQYNRDWSSFSPPSACRYTTTILAEMSTRWRIFLFGWRTWEKKKEKKSQPSKRASQRCEYSTHTRCLYHKLVVLPALLCHPKNISLKGRYKGYKSFFYQAFFKSACLN